MHLRCMFKTVVLFVLVPVFMCLCSVEARAVYSDEQTHDDDTFLSEKLGKKKFSSKVWKEVKEDMHFEKKDEPEHSNFSLPSWNLPPGIAYIFFGVLIIVALAFIINSIRGSFRPQPEALAFSFEAEENKEGFTDKDFSPLLAEALAAQNYLLALRLRFLVLLKEMAYRKVITWRNEKTNREYAAQLSGTHWLVDFVFISRVYETAWYGSRRVNAQEFEAFDLRCKNFFNQ